MRRAQGVRIQHARSTRALSPHEKRPRGIHREAVRFYPTRNRGRDEDGMHQEAVTRRAPHLHHHPRALASFEMFAYAFFTPMFDFDSTMTHPTISTMPTPRETHGVPVKPAIT